MSASPAMADEAEAGMGEEFGGRGDIDKNYIVLDAVCPLDRLCISIHPTEA